jgi:hypothetical protein
MDIGRCLRRMEFHGRNFDTRSALGSCRETSWQYVGLLRCLAFSRARNLLTLRDLRTAVCTENLIRVDAGMESPKLAE